MSADSPQAPQQVRDMGAEYAAIGMDFVHHYIFKVAQEAGPGPVPGSQRKMHQFRVGQQDARPRGADLFLLVIRHSAVVLERPNLAASLTQVGQQSVQGSK